MNVNKIKFKIYFTNGDVISFDTDYYYIFRYQWVEIRKYPEKEIVCVYHSDIIKKISSVKNGKELI